MRRMSREFSQSGALRSSLTHWRLPARPLDEQMLVWLL
jgi:hypothetical protein